MIELFVLNSDLDLIGEVSEYINLEFERKTDTYSQLILNIQADEQTSEILRVGNIISPQSNPTYGYVIEHFNYSQDGSETLEIVAFSLNYLLTLRTIYPQQYYSGTHEDIIRSFVNRNAINPSETYRKIPRLVLGDVNGVGTSTRSTKTGGDLLEHSMSIANEAGGSLDVLINFNTKELELVVWKGVNRTVNQSIVPRVVFSEDFDNILQQNYFFSLLEYKSSPIVAGEGEGEDRSIIDVNQVSGLNRRELYIDARDLRSSYQDDEGNEIQLTPQEYTNALVSRGNEEIVSTKIIETFEADIDNTQFVYGRDYFIGDTISVKNLRLNILLNVPVSTVKTISNSSGTTITPSLGSGLPDVFKRGGL